MVILLFVYAVNFNIFNELGESPMTSVISSFKLNLFCRNVRFELTDFLSKSFPKFLGYFRFLKAVAKLQTILKLTKLF